MRLVDKDKTVRSKPMRLLVLGISRTGTSSLCVALDKLGYKTFHMNECIAQPTRFFPLCMEAQKAKFGGEGVPYGRAEFDKILGDYDAVSDVPMVLFADELLEAYPAAKVILTIRDASKWADSMQQTIWLAHSWWTWDILAPFQSLIGLWRRGDSLDWDCFINSSPEKPAMLPKRRDYLTKEYHDLAIRRFNAHNDHVKKIVPKEKLLVFQAQEGWKPLCEFLGCDVPQEEYPRVWDKEALLSAAAQLWWVGVAFMLVQLLVPLGVVAYIILWVMRTPS